MIRNRGVDNEEVCPDLVNSTLRRRFRQLRQVSLRLFEVFLSLLFPPFLEEFLVYPLSTILTTRMMSTPTQTRMKWLLKLPMERSLRHLKRPWNKRSHKFLLSSSYYLLDKHHPEFSSLFHSDP